MYRASNRELEQILKLENVVLRGNTAEVNAAMHSVNNSFKYPMIPAKYPVCYFWLCKNITSDEYYWVFWTRGEQRPYKHGPILAEDPISGFEKRPQYHRDLTDSLWASESEFPKHKKEMKVDDYNGVLTMEMFESNMYFQTFNVAMRKDNNALNWRERVFKMVVKARTEHYQERYRVSRNDHYLKMALFWRYLDWKVLKSEHFAVMVMCYFKQINLGFVDALFRTHYT